MTQIALFEIIHECDEVEFKRLLQDNNPNAKWDGVPLLHYVIRNAGPAHLQLLIEAGVDVSAQTDEARPATALQWLTGRIHRKDYLFGWQRNYESHARHSYASGIRNRKLDSFIGTANEIMHQIAIVLCDNGAKKDFYSACALGEIELVFQYIHQQPSYLTEPGPDGSSALAWAARRGQYQVTRLLLRMGMSLEHENSDSHDTPLEEAVRHNGNLATIQLLIQNSAILRHNIIAKCGDNLAYIDYLLGISKSHSQLITHEVICTIKQFTYYEPILYIFYKHQVSLADIDRTFALERSLIFDGCWEHSKALRWLIAMGCDINAAFTPKDLDHWENDPLIGAKPMVFLAIHLTRRLYQEEKELLLQRMATLFFYGAEIEPSHAHQPHPINDLPDNALIQFLVFLYDEIKMHGATAIIKQSNATLAMLLEKTKVASLLTKDESTRAKLTSLALFCEPPSLQKACIGYIVQHGLFRNLHLLPADLRYQIHLLNKAKY